MKALIFTFIFCILSSQVLAYDVLLKWVDNSLNESGFVIERTGDIQGVPPSTAFSQIDTVGVNVTQYVDHLPNARARYCWRIKGTNAAGDSSYSNYACFTVPLPAPSKLTVEKNP